jgi:hypothetical protein
VTVPRICRVHDPVGVVPGRICGCHLPCREHPAKQGRKSRDRPRLNLTISREAKAVLDRLAMTGGSRSAVVEAWLLTQKDEPQ